MNGRAARITLAPPAVMTNGVMILRARRSRARAARCRAITRTTRAPMRTFRANRAIFISLSILENEGTHQSLHLRPTRERRPARLLEGTEHHVDSVLRRSVAPRDRLRRGPQAENADDGSAESPCVDERPFSDYGLLETDDGGSTFCARVKTGRSSETCSHRAISPVNRRAIKPLLSTSENDATVRRHARTVLRPVGNPRR